ncbi:MAG TPA: hypothetical protein VGR19_03705 [Allosphingosinicella sp.]|nr:hypothetical protein [Allosphingosinicella sp.]
MSAVSIGLLLAGCDSASRESGPKVAQGEESGRSAAERLDRIEARLGALEAQDRRLMNWLDAEEANANALGETDRLLSNNINETRRAINEHLNTHRTAR